MPSMALPLEINTVAATFIRGGAYGNQNYGGKTTLVIKDDNGSDYDRISLVRWDTLALKGRRPDSFKVEMQFYVIRAVVIDREICLDWLEPYNWSEDTVTWNNSDGQLGNKVKEAKIYCHMIKPSMEKTYVTFSLPGRFFVESDVFDARFRQTWPVPHSDADTMFSRNFPIKVIPLD